MVSNCDGSFVWESQLAACGITIADAHGQVIDDKAERFYCSYPIQAEAFAILGAVVFFSLETNITLPHHFPPTTTHHHHRLLLLHSYGKTRLENMI
ncbi:unnamed protein product [Linum trigynum]|uniref:RNase H type-1 domain-containing protein n=1 Tax=Linum trigynum TaxID=586398 RepID=A0AAV2CZC8_9ROSI